MERIIPSTYAFRFIAISAYAIDIQADKVLLLVERRDGWEVAAELLPATDADIIAAGGPVEFVARIIEAVNRALRVLFGKPNPGDIPPAADESLQSAVLAHLRERVTVKESMAGVPQLEPKPEGR